MYIQLLFICICKFQRMKWVKSSTLSVPLIIPFPVNLEPYFVCHSLPLAPIFSHYHSSFLSIGCFLLVIRFIFLFPFHPDSQIHPYFLLPIHMHAHCNLAFITHSPTSHPIKSSCTGLQNLMGTFQPLKY